MSNKIAVILIRGLVGIRIDIKDTLKSLKLNKKHACAVIEESPVTWGMLKKVQDFVTFGSINDETLKELQDKRGRPDLEGNIQNVFFLAPPVGGFERKGIKKAYTIGGALGDRKENINALIKKMI